MLGVSFHQLVDAEQCCQLVLSHRHFLSRIFLDEGFVSLVEAILLKELSNQKP